MRGGLDDALDKLARRDELRRRAEGGGIGTPPAVRDLVEAIAAVVGRNPALAVTVGVEGAGDPVLLHFAVQDGIVQVSADKEVASRVAEAAPTSPRHADFDIDPEDPVQESHPYSAAPAPETGQATRRISYDDPAFSAYRSGTYSDAPFGSQAEAPLANHAQASFGSQAEAPFGSQSETPFGGQAEAPFGSQAEGPFASHRRPEARDDATRRISRQHRRAADEPAATERISGHRFAEQHVMPTPLPEPVPLKVDSTETELAARRLAALLRDNPTLLRRSTPD